MDQDMFEKGLGIRREVLGAEYVDNAQEFRSSGPLRKQRRCGNLTAIAAYSVSEVSQNVALLLFASLRDSK